MILVVKTNPEVDECLGSIHDCDANANCINTVGSFECECHRGYSNSGNGKEGECHGRYILVKFILGIIRIKYLQCCKQKMAIKSTIFQRKSFNSKAVIVV